MEQNKLNKCTEIEISALQREKELLNRTIECLCNELKENLAELQSQQLKPYADDETMEKLDTFEKEERQKIKGLLEKRSKLIDKKAEIYFNEIKERKKINRNPLASNEEYAEICSEARAIINRMVKKKKQ